MTNLEITSEPKGDRWVIHLKGFPDATARNSSEMPFANTSRRATTSSSWTSAS